MSTLVVGRIYRYGRNSQGVAWHGFAPGPGIDLPDNTPLCVAPPPDTLRERLQQKCVDMKCYWRAPDAHGVELTYEQALDLLRDALGVEVDILQP